MAQLKKKHVDYLTLVKMKSDRKNRKIVIAARQFPQAPPGISLNRRPGKRERNFGATVRIYNRLLASFTMVVQGSATRARNKATDVFHERLPK